MLQRQKRNAIFDVKVLLPIDSHKVGSAKRDRKKRTDYLGMRVLPVRKTKQSTLFLGLGRDGVHDHRNP